MVRALRHPLSLNFSEVVPVGWWWGARAWNLLRMEGEGPFPFKSLCTVSMWRTDVCSARLWGSQCMAGRGLWVMPSGEMVGDRGLSPPS